MKDNGGSDNFFALLNTKANHSDEGKLGKMLLRSTWPSVSETQSYGSNPVKSSSASCSVCHVPVAERHWSRSKHGNSVLNAIQQAKTIAVLTAHL